MPHVTAPSKREPSGVETVSSGSIFEGAVWLSDQTEGVYSWWEEE